MKYGNWVGVSKYFLSELPKNRPYTKLEAAYSLQVDHDNKNKITISGYSVLWKWSRNKVSLFLKQMNIKILYTNDTKKAQNQKGQITIQNKDRKRAENGQIRLIDNSELQTEEDRKRAEKGQKKDRSKVTTIDPNPDPNPEPNNIAIPYKEIVEYLNQKTDKHFNYTSKETQRPIQARWNQGFRLDAFKYVIDVKSQQWIGTPKYDMYLRPQTLFGTKFESYLNEKTKHPFSDIVSDKTIKSIEALNEWERREIEHEKQN